MDHPKLCPACLEKGLRIKLKTRTSDWLRNALLRRVECKTCGYKGIMRLRFERHECVHDPALAGPPTAEDLAIDALQSQETSHQ